MPRAKRGRPPASPLAEQWRAALHRLLPHRPADVEHALDVLTSTILGACPQLEDSGGECGLVDLRHLSQLSRACGGSLHDLASRREGSPGVLLAWLRPDTHRASAFPCGRAADVGSLVLSDGSCDIPCSASLEAEVSPESLGQLVLLSRWKLVPPAAAAGGREVGAVIELDGPVHFCLPPLPPPRVAAFEVDGVWRSIRRMARDCAADEAARYRKLVHLRGELTSLSEPYGLRQPVFAAEFSAAAEGAAARGGCAESASELEDGCRTSNCCTVVLFVGAHAARWRGVMRVGEVYVLTNLRQDRLHTRRGGSCLVLRSSTDQPRKAADKPTVVWSDAVWHGRGVARKARVSPCPEREDVLTMQETMSASQHWGSRVGPTRSGSCGDGKSCGPAKLVSYEGEVTAELHELIIQLDAEWLLVLTHLPPRHRLGLRVGARVRVIDAHPLCIRTNGGGGEDCGWKLAGFGACMRTHVQVVSHSRQLETPLRPSRPVPWLRALSSVLTLTEMAEAWKLLFEGKFPWATRWEGVLSTTAQEEVLLVLLRAHEFSSLVEPSNERCTRSMIASSTAMASEHECDRPVFYRCLYDEFFSHAPSCHLGESRAPMPACPPLAVVLDDLAQMPLLTARMHDVEISGRAQLVLHEDVVMARSQPPLSTNSPLVLVGQLCLARSPATPALVLVDATGQIEICLPEAEMMHPRLPQLLGAVVSISRFHLLLSAEMQGTRPRVSIWTRLFEAESLVGVVCCPGQSILRMDAPLSSFAPADQPLTQLILANVQLCLGAPASPCCPAAVQLRADTYGCYTGDSPPLGTCAPEQITLQLLGDARRWRPVLAYCSCCHLTFPAGVSTSRTPRGWVLRASKWPPLLEGGREVLVEKELSSAAMVVVRTLYAATHDSSAAPCSSLKSPIPWRRGERIVSELHAVAHKLRPFSRVAVRAELLSVEVSDSRSGYTCARRGGQTTELRLSIGDSTGTARLEVYLEGAKVALPTKLLAGAHVLLSRALCVVAKASGRLYLKADEDTSILTLWSPCTDDFRAAAPASDLGSACAAQTAKPALLTSSAVDATLSELEPSAHGKELARRVLRLRLTLRAVYSVHLRMRCAACGTYCSGCRCRCATKERPLSLEVELDCCVTDGTGKAYLKATGSLVWALLQCSSYLVKEVRAIVAAAGPLSCRALEGFLCLSHGHGQWFCGPEQRLSSDAKKRLATLWDSTSRGQRDFLVHARVGKTSSTNSTKEGSLWISGEIKSTLFPEACTSLVACHIDPLNPCDELRRALQRNLANVQ
ncbi:hypothetical protein AB1Y20_022980 [Prymnesium parvum]|uniref:CST complex subunit CTC1 n=1 Tax=Prymnesium parvum TaxID=97485 RepID=A0AB34JFS1_PRYPA